MVYDRRVVPGAPAVVLLHGYGVDRSMWGPTLPALEEYTVFNVDLRGHGDSRPCARFSSPLSVDDFVKKTQFTYYTPQAFRSAAEDVDFFARQESLTGHGKSAMIRLEADEL